MKATRTLMNQHDDIRKTFKQLRKGNGHTGELVQHLASTLVAHMLVEQELLYPASLSKVDEGHGRTEDNATRRDERVLELYEEHAAARYMIERLVRTPPTERTFTAKLMTLQKLVLEHFEEEEDSLFSKIEKGLGDHSGVLGGHMNALFERTRKSGYAISRGGAAKATSSARRASNGESRGSTVSE